MRERKFPGAVDVLVGESGESWKISHNAERRRELTSHKRLDVCVVVKDFDDAPDNAVDKSRAHVDVPDKAYVCTLC